MNNLFIYLLQVTAGSVLLYLCFILFYRNDTFYKRNRVVLMLTMILPAILPLLSFGLNGSVADASQIIIMADRFATVRQELNNSVTSGMDNLNISTIVMTVWLSGLILLLLRTLISLFRTYKLIIKAERISPGPVRIVVSDLPHPPFSFWPYAVIPREIYNSPANHDIIRHEEFHIKQLHTIDLVFSELFIAVFWFNPAAWQIKRSIVLNHEYLADNKIINLTTSIKEYQYRLVNLAAGIGSIHLIHNFNNNLKNRIAMINKSSTKKIAALKTFLILPVTIFLWTLLSFKPTPGVQEKKDDQVLFSEESHKKIIKLLYTNISYPTAAKEQNLTGRFFVIIKMKKGGIVDRITVNDKDKSINIPLLNANDVVVVGYGLSIPGEKKNSNADLKILKDEGIRVAKMLETLKLPEWDSKDMEFAIPFSFDLKYPEPKTETITIRNNSFEVEPNVLFMVDGKEVTRADISKISPDKISTVSVLKDESATEVFGEKGKNGVIIITTKK